MCFSTSWFSLFTYTKSLARCILPCRSRSTLLSLAGQERGSDINNNNSYRVWFFFLLSDADGIFMWGFFFHIDLFIKRSSPYIKSRSVPEPILDGRCGARPPGHYPQLPKSLHPPSFAATTPDKLVRREKVEGANRHGRWGRHFPVYHLNIIFVNI